MGLKPRIRILDTELIQKKIIEKVTASPARLTPRHLEKTISEEYGLDKIRVKTLLKDLVASSELEYTYEFGNTYLVPAFNKPVHISAHVVIVPAGHSYHPSPDEAVVQIQSGAAFGGGRHPTTRLSICAIEFVLKEIRSNWLNENSSVLDIGTGSGILAIAALCLGVQKGLGIDIDPCAIAEARENLALNHMEDRLVVSDRKLDTIKRSFSMVTANLRYPSLKNFYPQITRLTETGGWVVLSGIRLHERESLMDLYATKHFEGVWATDELDWAAVVLKKI